MYNRAWRGRIGHLVPSSNVGGNETEFYEMARQISGVAISTARVAFPGGGYHEVPGLSAQEKALMRASYVDKLPFILERAKQAAVDLAAGGDVQVIVFGCTSVGYVSSPTFHEEINRILTEATNVPTITAATASIEGLNELGVKRVSACAPYGTELERPIKEFLEHYGFGVKKVKCLGPEREFWLPPWSKEPLRFLPQSASYYMAKKVDHPEAEAIFISCTAWPTLENVELLEKDLGKPVIAATQASFWAALRRIGVHQPVRGCGVLLSEHI